MVPLRFGYFFKIRVIFWNMLYKDVGVCYDGNTKLSKCYMGGLGCRVLIMLKIGIVG